MSEVPALTLEIPSSVSQQEVWDLDGRLKQIKGVSTDLQEPKNLLATVLLDLYIAASIMTQVGTIANASKQVYDVAKILYDFVQAKSEKHDVVVWKNGERIELKDLTIEEIERLLREP